MPLTLKITEQERARRLEAVEQALASVRLEGLDPGEDALQIMNRYIDGELTIEEMGAEIRALNERQFGPLPLPRH